VLPSIPANGSHHQTVGSNTLGAEMELPDKLTQRFLSWGKPRWWYQNVLLYVIRRYKEGGLFCKTTL
jgi:hypothetical protein